MEPISKRFAKRNEKVLILGADSFTGSHKENLTL